MAATNQTEFSNKIAEFAQKLRIKAGTLQKKITFDMHADIMKRTPVDTGRARANWFVSVGLPSKDVAEFPGVPTNYAMKKGKRVKVRNAEIPQPPAPELEIDGTRNTFIINNLPYIKALDEGHSKQAPNGMVKLAMKAQDARLEDAVKNL